MLNTSLRNELEDNNHHKQVTDTAARLPNTSDDREFTKEEIRKVIEGRNNKKAPGEDGITAEIYKLTFNIFPKSIRALYNGCLKTEFSGRDGRRRKLYRL